MGLFVIYLTIAESPAPELTEVHLLANFDRVILLRNWLELTPGRLAELDVKAVPVLWVLPMKIKNLPRLTEINLVYLAFSGEAES